MTLSELYAALERIHTAFLQATNSVARDALIERRAQIKQQIQNLKANGGS